MTPQQRIERIKRADYLEPVPECTPTFTLERQIAAARKEMGEARWQQLTAEWK